jgi:hypothetical protein
MGETALVISPPAESPSYTRLTRADHRVIMKLRDDGLTLTAIAQQLGRSVSTIHEVVDIYTPTDDLAKRKLRAGALTMAENIVDNGRAADHVAALKGLGVLEQDTFGVNVAVFGNGVDAIGPNPFAPSSAGSERRSTESLAITDGSDNLSSVT